MSKKSIYKKHVFVCVTGKTCEEQHSKDVLHALKDEIKELGLKKQIRINQAGCLGQCGKGPMVVVYPDNVWYGKVKPKDCSEIIEKHLLGDEVVKRLEYEAD